MFIYKLSKLSPKKCWKNGLVIKKKKKKKRKKKRKDSCKQRPCDQTVLGDIEAGLRETGTDFQEKRKDNLVLHSDIILLDIILTDLA